MGKQIEALNDALQEVLKIATELQETTPAPSLGFQYLEETRPNFQQEMARILSPLPGPGIEVLAASVDFDAAPTAEAEAETPAEASEAA